MSKLNKSNKSESSSSSSGFKPSSTSAKQPQKLEVVKIMSPKAPAPEPPIEEESLPVASSSDLPDQSVAATSLVTSAPNPDTTPTFPLVATTIDTELEHLQPIPPATESMQYRAIGVIQGRYVAQEDQFSKGQVIGADGSVVEAVLLGKTISIVKKRLDLNKDYLWVVYPRTREKTGELHVQIAGVWAPVEMGKSEKPIDPGVEDGYFSIRGEIVYQSVEQNYVMIKVQRTDRKKDLDKSKTKFKIRLEGILPTNAVNHFWNINAQREGNSLNILDGQMIAAMPAKSRKPARRPNNQQPTAGKRPFKPKPRAEGGVPAPRPISKPSLNSAGSAGAGQSLTPRTTSPVQRPSKPIIKRPKPTDS